MKYLVVQAQLLLLILAERPSRLPNSEIAEVLHRPIRSLAFPENSNMGLFFALAVPLEDPDKSISVSYFFEANYALPPNLTYLEPWARVFRGKEDHRERRNIDRATVYRIFQSKFESAGYSGRECLLRTICDTVEHPLEHNGIIGDIVHVLFTPSSSRDENLPEDIAEAELSGRNGTCTRYKSSCPVGLFDLIAIFL